MEKKLKSTTSLGSKMSNKSQRKNLSQLNQDKANALSFEEIIFHYRVENENLQVETKIIQSTSDMFWGILKIIGFEANESNRKQWEYCLDWFTDSVMRRCREENFFISQDAVAISGLLGLFSIAGWNEKKKERLNKIIADYGILIIAFLRISDTFHQNKYRKTFNNWVTEYRKVLNKQITLQKENERYSAIFKSLNHSQTSFLNDISKVVKELSMESRGKKISKRSIALKLGLPYSTFSDRVIKLEKQMQIKILSVD